MPFIDELLQNRFPSSTETPEMNGQLYHVGLVSLSHHKLLGVNFQRKGMDQRNSVHRKCSFLLFALFNSDTGPRINSNISIVSFEQEPSFTTLTGERHPTYVRVRLALLNCCKSKSRSFQVSVSGNEHGNPFGEDQDLVPLVSNFKLCSAK